MSAPRTTILVVEDDPNLREWYRHTLVVEGGYKVDAVGDGVSALRRIINGTPPDAVVLDLGLPRLGGRDVRQEMLAHAHTREIPVVVVTGTDTRDLDSSAYPCVLNKPVEPTQLSSAVGRCLTRRTKYSRGG